MRLQCLNLEVGGFPLEDDHPSAVLARRVGHKYAVACRRVRVNPIRNLGLLEYPQVRVGLSHPPQ